MVTDYVVEYVVAYIVVLPLLISSFHVCNLCSTYGSFGLLLQSAGKSAVLNSLIGHPVLVCACVLLRNASILYWGEWEV